MLLTSAQPRPAEVELDPLSVNGSFFRMNRRQGAPVEPVLVIQGMTLVEKPPLLGTDPSFPIIRYRSPRWAAHIIAVDAGRGAEAEILRGGASTGWFGRIYAERRIAIASRAARDAARTVRS